MQSLATFHKNNDENTPSAPPYLTTSVRCNHVRCVDEANDAVLVKAVTNQGSEKPVF